MIKLYIKGLYCVCKQQKEILINSSSVIELKTIEINNFCFQFSISASIFVRDSSQSGYFYNPENTIFSTEFWLKTNTINELIKKYINDNIKTKK